MDSEQQTQHVLTSQNESVGLRVLHLYRQFSPDFTGDGIYYERLLPILSQSDGSSHEVLVFKAPANNRVDKVLRSGEPSCVHYLTKKSERVNQIKLLFWMLRNVWRFDLVHVHTHIDRYFFSYLLARLAGRAVIYSSTLNDSVDDLIATYRPVLRPVARKLFSTLNAFIAISPRLFSGHSRGIDRRRAVLIPQGVQIPELENGDDRRRFRAELGLSSENIVLLYVGSITVRKNVLFLVEEFSELSTGNPNLRLLLVGPPLEEDYASRIDLYITQKGLQGRILRVPFTPQPQAYYAAADIFVFASLSEGFGNVLIEAMSFGLPVVSRYLENVTTTFIEDGRSGYLFSESGGFRSAVRLLASDAEIRRNVGSAGREVVKDRYAMDKIAGRVGRLYRNVVETGLPSIDDFDP